MRTLALTVFLGAMLGPVVMAFDEPVPGRSVTERRSVQCTAFCLHRDDRVVVGKNLDWDLDDGIVVVNKRGVLKTGWSHEGSSELSWKSRFGSVTFNQLGREFPLGGINEAGLVVEELSYWPSQYPENDDRPEINELQWIQYQLDRSASVDEVLDSDRTVRIGKYLFGLHYLVADRSGKVAIVEFLEGQRVVYTGESVVVPVLANDTYARSLRYLRMHSGFGGERAGTVGSESPERFVRAARGVHGFAGSMPRVDPIDFASELLESVRQSNTQWSIVYDLREPQVHFSSRSFPASRTLRLGELDLSCSSPTLVLGLSAGLAGLEDGSPKIWNDLLNRTLIDDVFSKLESLLGPGDIPTPAVRALQARYPLTTTCRLAQDPWRP